METFLNFVDIAWPRMLLMGAFVWSLMSSGLAWWLSGKLARRWWWRCICALLLWLIVFLLRIVIFIILLVKGIMPWNQAHAWKIFTKLVECYIDHKQDTLMAILVSVLIQLPDEDGKKGERVNVESNIAKKMDDFTFGDLATGIKENDGLLCDAAMVEFLKILYSITPHDQDYMTALFSLLAKSKDDAGFVRKAIGGVFLLLSKINIMRVQSNLITIAKIIADSVIKIACGNNEREVAYECILLKQMIIDLGQTKIHSNSGDKISSKINKIAKQLNKVGAMLRIMIEFRTGTSDVKLLEYKT